MIGEASQITAAVQKIGGASKLTAEEQGRVNTALNQAIEKYTALGRTAPKAMQDLERATRRVDPSFITTKMIALGSAIGSFVGNIAVNAVMSLGNAIVEAASNGAKLTQLSGSFERLSKSVNQTASVMLSTMRTATKGLVSDLDLMQSANKAILLGLPVTAQEMGTLAQTALVLGRAMGLDATTALNDLVTALGRSSPLILDNLGLTVKLGEANENFARSIGKSANDLTDAERKLAFYRAAMDAARRKVDELGEAQLGAIDQLKRLGVELENNVTGQARAANESGVLTRALGFLADKFEEANRAARDFDEISRRMAAGNRGSAFQIWAEIREDLAREAAQSRAPELPLPSVNLKAVGPTDAEIKLIEQANDKLKQAFEEAAETARRLRAELSGEELLQTARQYETALKAIGGASRLTASEQESLVQVFDKVVEKYRLLGAAGAPVVAHFEAVAATVRPLLETLPALASVYTTLAPTITANTEALAKYNQLTNSSLELVLEQSAALKELNAELARQGMLLDFSAHVDNKPSEEVADIQLARIEEIRERWRQTLADIGRWTVQSISDAFADAVVGLHSFEDAFLDIWNSIRRAFSNILASMLDSFVEGFLKGMLRAIGAAKLGEVIGNAVLGGTAGAAIGGGAASGGAAGVAGAGGGSLLANPAFWTNPITLGVAAAATVLTLGITKKGWFRGGEEGVKVNPRRDQFQLANFGRSGDTVAQAGQRMAAMLTRITKQPGGGPLFAAMQRADSVKEFESAQAAIVAAFAGAGRQLKSFMFGGFVPPGMTQLAVLHGGARGEVIAPVASMSGGAMAAPTYIYRTVNLHIAGVMDRDNVRQVMREHVYPELHREMMLDQHGFRSATRRATRP